MSLEAVFAIVLSASAGVSAGRAELFTVRANG